MLYLIPMLAVLLGGLVKGVTGFGSAIVAVPLLSLVMPPAHAILLVALTDLVTGAWLWWGTRALVRTTVLVAMLVPAVAGQWVGTSMLMVLPVSTTRAVVAVVVAILALAMLWRPVRADGPVDRLDCGSPAALGWAGVAGLGGGLLSGMVGMPGPPVVVWVRRYLSDAAGRAQLIAFFVPEALVLVGLLLARGLVPMSSTPMTLLLAPSGLLGAWLGARLAPRLDPVTFGRTVGALLLLACGGLLWR